MAYQVTAGRFVGRTEELARLRGLLAHAAAGDGGPLVALIGGEAGVGKTRLAEQLAAASSGQGVRVLSGGCVPLGEEGVPFAPVVEALRGLAGDLEAAELAAVAGPARAELGRLLPGLGWGGEAAPLPAVADPGQGRLFELLLGVIQRLAAHAPLLWVMEDLHWADRSTRDLLAYLAAALRSGRVLLVATFRSDELPRAHPLRPLLGELAPQPPRAAAGVAAVHPRRAGRAAGRPARRRPARPPGRRHLRPFRRQPVLRRRAAAGRGRSWTGRLAV